MLVQVHAPLTDLLKRFRKKFPRGNTDHLMDSLKFFDDADAEPTPKMLIPLRWSQVKRVVAAEVDDLRR